MNEQALGVEQKTCQDVQMDPETEIGLGAALVRLSSLRDEFVAMQARMDGLRRRTSMIADCLNRAASQIAMIKDQINQRKRALTGRVAHPTSGELASENLPPGSQSKWPVNDLLDLNPLSPAEFLRAKAVVTESAFWGMVYLALHHIPRALAVASTAEERDILAVAVKRTAQDNRPPRFSLWDEP